MLSTLFLAATLAQIGSSGGSFPSSSSDTGTGSMGTPPMDGVLPAADPARDRGPTSSGTTGTTGTSGGGLSSPTTTGASGTGSSAAGTESEGETSGRVSGGGTGTTGDSSTNGGTNSTRPLR
jgi:hypothetical protein